MSKIAETNPQADNVLLQLPAELRDAIYFYLFDFDCQTFGRFSSSGRYRRPRIDLLNAGHHAPSNALLATCRIIYQEARDIFVQAQKDFWHKTTFTTSLTETDGVHAPVVVGHHERLRNEQVQTISRIVIKMENAYGTKIYMTTEPESDRSSWQLCCVSNDEAWGEFIGDTLYDARKYALSPDQLRHTQDHLRASYERAKMRMDRLDRPSGDVETPKEMRESIVVFEQAQQNLERLELMFVICWCCDSFNVEWSQRVSHQEAYVRWRQLFAGP